MSDAPAEKKCEECPPAGAPAWMATFSDLVTLLLTFFVLLYAMSKTDENKFRAVAGSIRKAFAGNTKSIGETIQLGKSPDDAPTMIESQEPVKPYPIDLITTDGFLDKYEINRESEEDLRNMKAALKSYGLEDYSKTYQMKEGVKIFLDQEIVFKFNSLQMDGAQALEVMAKVIRLMKSKDWNLTIVGHAQSTETYQGGPFDLAAKRAIQVMKAMVKRGVPAERVEVVSMGDVKKEIGKNNRRVQFLLRKRSLLSKDKLSP